MKSKTYRYDLLKWALTQTKESYRSIAARSGVSRMTLCDTVRGVSDPTASTIKATFTAFGIDPKYALDFKLKRAEFPQFRCAVVEAANRREAGR
jgi:transcriptional regulator with XRE-family HTH domain